MKIFANPTTLFKKEPWFKTAYYNVRSWIKFTFNKDHLALMKEAYTSRPYDHYFLTQLEYQKIKEMVNYQDRVRRHVDVEYEIRDMRICLSLLEIILEKRELFHYTGDLVFVPIPEEERKEDYKEGDMKLVPTPDFKYHCDVNVNLKNMKRFVHKEKLYEFYTSHPDEFYRLKAKALYHKIRFEHEEEWWD